MQVQGKDSLYGHDTGKYIVSRKRQEEKGVRMGFENQKVDIWIVVSDRKVERIYIAAPDLEGVALTRSSALKRRVSTMADLKLIHLWLEQQHAKNNLFNLIQAELSGYHITVDVLDDTTRDWLRRRGFQTDEIIERLASVSQKGFAAALHLLTCILSHEVRASEHQPLPGRLFSNQVGQRRDKGKFTAEEASSMRSLYLEAQKHLKYHPNRPVSDVSLQAERLQSHRRTKGSTLAAWQRRGGNTYRLRVSESQG